MLHVHLAIEAGAVARDLNGSPVGGFRVDGARRRLTRRVDAGVRRRIAVALHRVGAADRRDEHPVEEELRRTHGLLTEIDPFVDLIGFRVAAFAMQKSSVIVVQVRAPIGGHAVHFLFALDQVAVEVVVSPDRVVIDGAVVAAVAVHFGHVSEAVDHERPRDCALGPVGGVIGFSLGAGHMLSAPRMVRNLGIGGYAAGLRLGNASLAELATGEAVVAGTFASLIAVLIGWNANVATGAARPPVAAGTG